MPDPGFSTLKWGQVDLRDCPRIVVLRRVPSPAAATPVTRYFKGLSGQVKLFPVAFESGEGCVLVDVDGNRYIDFSSGIYVTTLGHCHPKVSEAVARYAGQLMNAHDFTTPIKTLLVEKLAEVLPGDFGGFQFYDAGTAAVEAGMRVLRAATGQQRDAQLLQRFPRQDLRGRLAGADSLARLWPRADARGPHGAPRPTRTGRCGPRPTARSTPISISPSTTSTLRRARSATWPASCWSRSRAGRGSVMPPDDFFPKLRRYCDEKRLLLMADEVLTSWGRTGKWLCMEHWGVVPDVVAIGKGFGNGFPVTAVAVREPFAESFEKISASSSYGGNPMACAAALASTEVIEEENLLEHAAHLGELALRRMEQMKAEHAIVGDVRVKGCLMGIELVKDRTARRPSTRRESWSTRRPSARAWPGFRPDTSCA